MNGVPVCIVSVANAKADGGQVIRHGRRTMPAGRTVMPIDLCS
ncbi:hypothetical protein [Gluconacetobacter tumulisoli]|nr:hypothetical protein [Gluconacetobacter tumulisoli]